MAFFCSETFYKCLQNLIPNAKFSKDREIVKISYMKDVKQLNSSIPDDYKDWQIIAFEAYEKSMYPDDAARHIILAREDASKEWIVINEGY